MDEDSWREAAREVRWEIEDVMWNEKSVIKRTIWRQVYMKILKLEKGFKEMDI